MPLENKSFSEADLSFGVENFETDAILKITNMTSKKTIRLECKLYVSPLSINAPDKHIKARLKSSYFDILIYLKTGLLTYRFDSYDNILGNDSNLLIVFYVQIMPDDFVMQLHRF